MTVDREIGETVRWHRRQAGLSREQLALLAGVGKTVIYDLEHGKDSLRWNTILRILAALNISLRFDSPLLRQAGEPR